MTIRGTQNQSIKGNVRSVLSESFELILAGASEALAVTVDAREIDTPAAFQTTLPSNDHNGVTE